MKQKISIEIICSLLILLFVYTAISKLADRNHFAAVMAQIILMKKTAALISIALPVIELMVAALLFIPGGRLQGLYASLGLMIVFTFYIGYMILFAKHLPCNCGGVLQKMNWHEHFIFNLFFIVLSVIGIKLYHSNKNIVATEWQPDQQPQGKS